MNNGESDSEEEILVYAEFEDNVINIDQYRAIHVLGINDKNPIVQLDDTFFMGKYEHSLGTYMFFEPDPAPPSKDPLFDKYPDRCLKYVCNTRKFVNMDHAYVTPKEGKESNLESHKQSEDDVKPIAFANIQEGIEAFKPYFSCESAATEELSKSKNEYHTGTIKQRRQNTKKKESVEDVLLRVVKSHVKINKQERKKNNVILYSVLEKFLQKMKSCDALFKSLKPKLAYLGSYFDGLRVGHATEYDINVVLTFHLNYDKITLDADNMQGPYTTIRMPSEFRRLSKTPATANKGFEDTKLWCDRSYRLSVTRFRSWMQRVVDATLNTLPIENGMRIIKINHKSYQVAAKISGPANTLTIIENQDNIIDIDLVPTLEFKLPKEPNNSTVEFDRALSTNIKEYFVVPKPNNNEFSWRLAFPFQERYYIYNKDNMKNTIKILKLLRDAQGFNKLASYYIKTIFLWAALENTDGFWKSNSLSFLVIYMLKKLQQCLLNQTIKNFWCPSHNLLEKIKTETCHNWSNRLARIISMIEDKKSDPHVILNFLINNN